MIEKAEETYRQSQYTNMVTDMQKLENKHLFEDKESMKEKYNISDDMPSAADTPS